jgi:hypothetical protein
MELRHVRRTRAWNVMFELRMVRDSVSFKYHCHVQQAKYLKLLQICLGCFFDCGLVASVGAQKKTFT